MLRYGQQLANEHHVVRYVPWSKLLRDGDDNVIGFLFSAFQLKSAEDDLSVNWLEFSTGSREFQITECVKIFRRDITVGAKSAFAIGRVDKLKEIGSRQVSGRAIKVIFTPTETNAAHSSVEKLPRDEFALLELLAVECFTEMVPNGSISSDD